MNAQRAERVVSTLSVFGIWIAFLVSWGLKDVQAKALSSHGADLPVPTLMWLDFSGSWISFAFPAICTMLIVWLMRRRSVHLNWVAGALLFLGTCYAALGQTAAILPVFRMCAPV